MRVFCGIDWAGGHHDVALVDHDGALLARARITDAAGLQQLLDLLAAHGDTEADRLRQVFRLPQMRRLPLVEQATGRQTLALLRQLDAACASVDDLTAAERHLFNRVLGCLHHCLSKRTPYDEATAFSPPQLPAPRAAA